MSTLTINSSLASASRTTPAGDRRAKRVDLLLVAIAGLSAVDLIVTLYYMNTVGMFEANPIVRHLAQCAHPAWAIALFKALSVMASVTPVSVLRQRATAELGAWAMVGVLVWVTVQWACYALTIDAQALAEVGPLDPAWVRLD